MDKGLRNISIGAAVLAAVSFCWLLFDLAVLSRNYPDVLLYGRWSSFAAVGYLFILAFHAVAIIMLIMHFRLTDGDKMLRTLSIAAGVVSLCAIAVQKVMYDEIGREFAAGYRHLGELVILEVMLSMNALFAFLVAILVYRILQNNHASIETIKDERIFILAQYLGVVSGILGIYLTISVIVRHVPVERFWIYIPFYMLLLVPYGITLVYWLVMKSAEKAGEWYDEKQWYDILRASLTTLLLSVPGLAIIMLFNSGLSLYWYPYYLFMTLSFFSGSTLYYFRKA